MSDLWEDQLAIIRAAINWRNARCPSGLSKRASERLSEAEQALVDAVDKVEM